MPLKLFVIFFIFLSTHLLSQNPDDFISRHAKINVDSLNVILKNNREAYIKRNQKEDPSIINEFRKNYNERIKEIDLLCKGDYLFWDDTLTRYLKGIVYKIQASSPFIKKDIILLVTKTLVPNAASWGDNVIIINTGILTKYEHEGELAYIICHELAHDYLDHIFKTSKVNYTISKQTKFNQKYRRAQRAKYQTAHKVNEVIEEYLSAVNTYSRKDELQADSLGAVLLVKAGYSYKNAVNSLSILETVDDAFFTDELDLKKIFTGKEYAFNDKWLQQDDVLDQKIYREKLDDSLNTHPECKDRIKALITEFKIDTNIKPANNPVDITFINQKAYFEDLQFCYGEGRYLFSLYHGLQLLQKHPQSDYLTDMICGSLYHISYALKKHRFSYYSKSSFAANK